VLKFLKEFKQITEKEKSPNDRYQSELYDEVKKKSRSKVNDKQKAKVDSKMPDSSGIRNKYFIYIAKFFVFIGIVIGLVVANSITGRISIDFFKDNQAQAYLIERMAARTFVAQIASQELLATNNIATVENQLASEKIPLVIEELKQFRQGIAKMFLSEDLTYESTIADLLYNDGCKFLSGSNSQMAFFCTILRGKEKKTGLVYLLSYLEDMITERLQKWSTSDRSEASLTEIEASNFEDIVSVIFVLTNLCLLGSGALSQQFQVDLNNAADERVMVLTIFCIALAACSIIIWFLVLDKLKEANNQFKKVMQSLPATHILSNFILKNFLFKTSKGALEFVRNEI